MDEIFRDFYAHHTNSDIKLLYNGWLLQTIPNQRITTSHQHTLYFNSQHTKYEVCSKSIGSLVGKNTSIYLDVW
jgi:hypothetical protein